MGRNNLEKSLETLSSTQIRWFAIRCALRSLAALAYHGKRFPFWKHDSRSMMFMVFRACSASIAQLEFDSNDDYIGSREYNAVDSAAEDAKFAAGAAKATAYTYVANSACFAAMARSASAAYNACAAAISAANDASYNAAAKAAADASTVVEIAQSAAELTTSFYTAAAKADLFFIRSNTSSIVWPDLWHNKPFELWQQWEEGLLSGLKLLKLDYWAKEYVNWTRGEFDQEKLDRCLFMPESTVKAGSEAMLIYLQAELVRMAESRVVFLGEGEAGKTSLVRILFGENVQGDEPATPRVEIRHRLETINGDDIRVHYWDFGGQVIMHATHQFFLREKSIYVVVLDIRRCDSLEYWLDHVRVFASGSPTLIVLNKVDFLPSGIASRPHFDINEIRRRYPFVINNVFLISCKTEEGVAVFVHAIKAQIASNHVLRPDMPLQWFKVKEALSQENLNYIDLERFEAICREQGIRNEEIKPALAVLDNLGVAIYFPQLTDTQVVLNPEWITKAIYYIIWASEKQKLDGKLDERKLKSIFQIGRTSNDLDVDVPDGKLSFLLGLMSEFKLAFKVKGSRETYCVPMLAPINEPDHGLTREGSLRFLFVFPFLPPSLFYRFIADSGFELVDYWIWKNGAMLSDGDTKVLLIYSEYQRSITLYGHGQSPGFYLTTLRQRFMKLLGESYKDLEYDSFILTSDNNRINWRDMVLNYEEKGAFTKFKSGGITYNIVDLLRSYFGNIGDMLNQLLERERMIMVNNTNTNIVTASPVITVNQTTTLSVNTVNAIQSLLHVDSDLKVIEELLEDFKDYHKEKAVESEGELRKLEREITRLRCDISELEKLTSGSPIDEAKKKPLWGRIKERWEKLADLSKQCYYVIGFAEKIHKISDEMAKIDWVSLLK